MGVCVRVPATTANLGPGFDTFGMALTLYNTIEADWSNGDLEIIVSGDKDNLIPTNKTNAIFRVMELVFEKTGKKALLDQRSLRIRIQNDVPVTRGLGSSATAIVGGLWAANELLGQPLSKEELVQMAVDEEGHPDNVTPAIYGGIVISGTVKGHVYTKGFTPPAGMKCVVAVPDFQLATKTSRMALPIVVPHTDAVFNANRVGLMVAALIDGNIEILCDLMEDRLHEPFRMPLIPGMKKAIGNAKKAGALAAVLSGSGPTLIAFCTEKEAEIGQALQAGFQSAGINSTIMQLSPAKQGVAVMTSIL